MEEKPKTIFKQVPGKRLIESWESRLAEEDLSRLACKLDINCGYEFEQLGFIRDIVVLLDQLLYWSNAPQPKHFF